MLFWRTQNAPFLPYPAIVTNSMSGYGQFVLQENSKNNSGAVLETNFSKRDTI